MFWDKILYYFMSSLDQNLSLIEIAILLVLPSALTVIVALAYLKWSERATVGFILSLFVLAPVTSLLTRALDGHATIAATGGLCAILCYRRAPRSQVDAAFLLWTGAIGLCCGVGYYLAAFSLALYCSVVLLFLGSFNNIQTERP